MNHALFRILKWGDGTGRELLTSIGIGDATPFPYGCFHINTDWKLGLLSQKTRGHPIEAKTRS